MAPVDSPTTPFSRKSSALVASTANHFALRRAVGGSRGVLILDTDILTIIQFRQGESYQRIVARRDFEGIEGLHLIDLTREGI